MSIFIRIGLTIVHLALAVFLALTSYPGVRPALGIGGYILVITIIDIHAYLQTAYWLFKTPGQYNLRFAVICGLTLLSAGISIYSADLTASMFVPDTVIDNIQAQVDQHRDSIDQVNAARLADHQKAEERERERVAKEEAAIRRSNEKAIAQLSGQADGLRWNGYVGSSSKIAKQMAALSEPVKIEAAIIAPPILAQIDEAWITELQRRIDEKKSRKARFAATAVFLECGLTVIMFIFLFGQDQDTKANLIILFVDYALKGTRIEEIILEMDNATTQATTPTTGKATTPTTTDNTKPTTGDNTEKVLSRQQPEPQSVVPTTKKRQQPTTEQATTPTTSDNKTEVLSPGVVAFDPEKVEPTTEKGNFAVWYEGEIWTASRIRTNLSANKSNWENRGSESARQKYEELLKLRDRYKQLKEETKGGAKITKLKKA